MQDINRSSEGRDVEPGRQQRKTEPENRSGWQKALELFRYVKGSRLGRYQARTFLLTWTSYASYYLTRKPFAVVKTTVEKKLGIHKSMQAAVDTSYLTAYAVGQFVSGNLGDRFGSRMVLGVGMIGTAVCSYLFGVSSTATMFIALLGIMGFFQSTGWSGNVKAMTPWFGLTQRGTVMGFWGTCYQVGGLVATALAGFILKEWGWRTTFTTPAIWVAFMGVLILLFLVDTPESVGLESQDKVSREALFSRGQEDEAGSEPPDQAESEEESRMRFTEALRLPGILNLGATYFSLKLIRYVLLLWLPSYLNEECGYAADTSAYMSGAFELGGIFGAIIIGYLSDRYVAGRRVLFAAPLVFGIGLALLLYQAVGKVGMVPNVLSLALVGFCLFGPDSLISGAAAQDLGGQRGAGSAAGIINGMGSFGAILQGWLAVTIQKRWGWAGVYRVLAGMAFLASAMLLPLVKKDLKAIKEERAQAR